MQSAFKDSFIMIVKGVFLTLIIALVGTLIFSGVVKLASLGDGVIKPVNQFIKTLSVFLGCFFTLKGRMGYLKGGLCGLFGILLTFLVFALIGGGLDFGLPFLLDLLLGLVLGAISGIITVNVKNK